MRIRSEKYLDPVEPNMVFSAQSMRHVPLSFPIKLCGRVEGTCCQVIGGAYTMDKLKRNCAYLRFRLQWPHRLSNQENVLSSIPTDAQLLYA